MTGEKLFGGRLETYSSLDMNLDGCETGALEGQLDLGLAHAPERAQTNIVSDPNARAADVWAASMKAPATPGLPS